MNRSANRKAKGKSLHRWKAVSAGVLAVVLLGTLGGVGQQAPETSPEMALALFRSRVEAHLSETMRPAGKSREKATPVDLRPADAMFLQLLLIQARDAAAHQSLDRLSGWSKSIQSRFETQNAPSLDVDVVRFAEARMAAESARIEAEQKRMVERANSLMGRPPAAPLTALLPAPGEDLPEGVEKQQKDLLAQGEELISKMYKSYEFGGISVTSLMEYEHGLYQLEVEYRQQVARAAVKLESEDPAR